MGAPFLCTPNLESNVVCPDLLGTRNVRPVPESSNRDNFVGPIHRSADPFAIYWQLLSSARYENPHLDSDVEVELFERALAITDASAEALRRRVSNHRADHATFLPGTIELTEENILPGGQP